MKFDKWKKTLENLLSTDDQSESDKVSPIDKDTSDAYDEKPATDDTQIYERVSEETPPYVSQTAKKKEESEPLSSKT